jgi:hypothetical protein
MQITQTAARIFIIAVLVFAAGCKSDTRSKEGATPGPIKSSIVDFPGMQLRPGSDKASFTLIGRIRNKSAQQTITEVKLRLTLEDVLVSGATTTVGDTLVIVRQELPPGQSKSFSENVAFEKLPSPKGRHEWNYSIAGITVKE